MSRDRSTRASALRSAALGVVFPCLLVAWLGVPAPAVAQLEVGRRALEAADFQRALRAFDRAERTESLDRDGLISLAEGRILARFALGTAARARADLATLAALDPTHTFPVEAPPEVAAALAAAVASAGGGLAAGLVWEDGPEGAVLSVEAVHDGPELVRAVRVHVRVGDGAWQDHEQRRLVIPHPPGVAVAAWVELLGARDVVLVRTGSAEAPVVHGTVAPTRLVGAGGGPTEDAPARRVLDAPTGDTPAGSDDTGLAVGLGVGAAVLVAAGVVLAVFFGTQTSAQTQPATPMVVGF